MRLLVMLGAVLQLTGTARGITATELAELRRDGGAFRLIDVRPTVRFRMGSIPGAMSVPSAVLLEKNFAPLGRVVLFGDGLGDVDMDRYLEALNLRPGVQAEELDGGYAAWLDEGFATTARSGVTRSKPPMISYKRLEAFNRPVIMVDLRRPGVKEGAGDNGRLAAETAARKGALDEKVRRDSNTGGGASSRGVAGDAETTQTSIVTDGVEGELDVLQAFCKVPGRELCKDLVELRRSFASPNAARGGPAGRATHEPTPMIVLVDNDSVTAEEACRRMKISGYNRVVILAGGELALQTKGRPGLSRVGGRIFKGGFDGLDEKTTK